MDKNVVLHGVYAKRELYSREWTLYILEQVLKSGALLSARMQNKDNHNILFNGMDYISLCDLEKWKEFVEEYDKNPKKHYGLEKDHTAYEMYIRHSLSLMFPKNKVDTIPVELIQIRYKPGFQQIMASYGMDPDVRYSDLPDEVQAKDSISLDKMSGITLPVCKINRIIQSENKLTDAILKEVEAIHKLLAKYNYQAPIYDIDTGESLDSVENVKKVAKYCKKYRNY